MSRYAKPIELECGLGIHECHIRWKERKIFWNDDIIDFSRFIHGPILQKKLHVNFHVFTYLLYRHNILNTVATPDSNQPKIKFIDIVKEGKLLECLQLNYVPMGKSYRVNPCEKILNEWISSGRLAVFEEEFVRLYETNYAKNENKK